MLLLNLNSGNIVNSFGKKTIINEKGELLLPLQNSGIVTDGLVQHLIGGKGIQGTTWVDQSNNNNDATLVNSPIVNADSIVLDGIDNYINLNVGNSLSEFTLSITLEYLSLTNYDRLINQISNVVGTWSLYAINSDQGVDTMEFYTNPQWHDCLFAPVINTKYTIDFVVDNTNTIIKIYVNGVFVKSINDNVFYTSLGIGNKYRGIYGTNLNAKIFDYKEYDRVLSPQEITQNYNAL